MHKVVLLFHADQAAVISPQRLPLSFENPLTTRPCAEMNSTSIWYAVFLGVAALVVAAFLAYRHAFLPRQVAPPVSVLRPVCSTFLDFRMPPKKTTDLDLGVFQERNHEKACLIFKVKSLLQKLITLQAPVLLQMVQLWSVLSRLGRSSSSPYSGSSRSGQSLPEVPYLETWGCSSTDLSGDFSRFLSG